MCEVLTDRCGSKVIYVHCAVALCCSMLSQNKRVFLKYNKRPFCLVITDSKMAQYCCSVRITISFLSFQYCNAVATFFVCLKGYI